MNVKAVLIEAKSFLTEETWFQGSYFALGNAGNICACSHGAVQRVINPVVQTILKNWSSARADYARLQAIVTHLLAPAAAAAALGSTTGARATASASAAAGAMAAGEAEEAAAEAWEAWADWSARAAGAGAGVVDIWMRRPAWLDEQTDAGDLRAHYVLGMVGLTVGFNDSSQTTLAHVHAKFDEAIKVAEILGI